MKCWIVSREGFGRGCCDPSFTLQYTEEANGKPYDDRSSCQGTPRMQPEHVKTEVTCSVSAALQLLLVLEKYAG
jgi:hypothetical protein